jgi:hypothetical protein
LLKCIAIQYDNAIPFRNARTPRNGDDADSLQNRSFAQQTPVRNHVKFRDRHLQHANALIDSHSGHDAKPTDCETGEGGSRRMIESRP